MDTTLHRLLEISNSLPHALRKEQRELVLQLAQELNVPLAADSSEEPIAVVKASDSHKNDDAAVPEEPTKKTSRDEPDSVTVSAGRDKFQKQEQNASLTRREARKPAAARPPPSTAAPTTGGECDLSNPDIKNAYDQVRDDSSPVNWLLLGYGSSKKTLELYGSGEGGLGEFVSNLKEDEITYGYVRVIYGDSQRSKFVFVTHVPEGLSGLNKAKANMHKPSVTSFLKYMHIEVHATSTSELTDAAIQQKLTAAAGANYGTSTLGGTAPKGSEDYGSIKDNAKSFFMQTESKGNRQSIVYNKGPLSETTPVALQGRAGITEKYIKV